MNCGCKFVTETKVSALPAGLRPRFLGGLIRSDLSAVLAAARHRKLLPSSVVVQEDDPAERIFLLTSGLGRQFVLTKDGRKILLRWLTAGEIFGGVAALFAPHHYLSSTEMLSEGCALTWDRRTIRDLVARIPRLLDNGLSIAVTEHIAWLLAMHISLSTNDAMGRIAHMVVSLACGIGQDGPDGIEIRVANEDLAAAANVTPFTVSRALSTWQREGILTKGRGKVILRKPQFLLSQ